MDESGSQEMSDEARWQRLTARQRACLDLLLERRTSKQIARVLGISKHTADQRIAAARVVLGAADRNAAARAYARLRSLYDPVAYDPVQVPAPGPPVPSPEPDGGRPPSGGSSDKPETGGGPRVSQPPSGKIVRRDHPVMARLAIMTIMLVAAVVLILAGLGIAEGLAGLLAS